MKKWTFTLIVLLTILCSCKNDVKDISKDGTATQSSFTVQKINAQSIERGANNSQWPNLENQSTIWFKACLQDKALLGPVVSHEFQIHSNDKVLTKNTDASGCLYWSETFLFDFLQKERFHSYPVKIVGIGAYKGERTLNLWVNPWSDSSSSAIKDLGYEELSDTLKGIMALDQTYIASHNENLVVENAQFIQIENNTSSFQGYRELVFDYEIELQSKRLGLYNEEKFINFDKGEFKVKLYLTHKETQEERSFVLSEAQQLINIQNGLLKGKVTFTIDSKKALPPQNLWHMIISIEPFNAPYSLSNALGSIEMDFLKKNKTSTLELINDLGLKISHQEKKSLNQKDNCLGDFCIGKVEFKSKNIISESHQKNSKLEMEVGINVCLFDPLGNNGDEPITQQSFTLNLVRENQTKDGRGNFITDRNGCFEASLNLYYDQFSAQRYIPFTLEIIGQSKRYKDLIQTREISINPWASNIGIDHKYQTPVKDVDQESSRITFDNVNIRHDGMVEDSFHVNEFLQLDLKKRYDITFNPKVKYGHSYSGNEENPKITFGRYKLEVTLLVPKSQNNQKIYFDAKDYYVLTSSEKEVNVNSNGIINTNMDFPLEYSDLFKLSYRNVAIITLSPLYETPLQKAVVMATPFIGHTNGSYTIPVHEIETNFNKDQQSIITEIKTHKRKIPKSYGDNKTSTKEYFCSYLKKFNPKAYVTCQSFEEYNQRAMNDSKLNQNHIQELTAADSMKISPDVTGRLCSSLYSGDLTQSCKKTPNDFLDYSPIYHIEQLSPTHRPLYTQGHHQSLQMGYAYYASEGERSYEGEGERRGESHNTNRLIGLEGPAPLYLGYSKGVVQSHEFYSISASAQMRAAFDREFKDVTEHVLGIDWIELALKAKVTKCLLTLTKKGKDKKILHLCHENRFVRQGNKIKYLNNPYIDFKERWYTIYDTKSLEHYLGANANTLNESTPMQIIRGEKQFQRYWGHTKNESLVIFLKKKGEIDLKGAFDIKLEHSLDDNIYNRFNETSFPGAFIPVSE